MLIQHSYYVLSTSQWVQAIPTEQESQHEVLLSDLVGPCAGWLGRGGQRLAPELEADVFCPITALSTETLLYVCVCVCAFHRSGIL